MQEILQNNKKMEGNTNINSLNVKVNVNADNNTTTTHKHIMKLNQNYSIINLHGIIS
jgi:hypothetical protein